MNKEKRKQYKRERRRLKVRAKIKGTLKRPRLSLFKSNKGMYLQLINDEIGKTLLSAHSREIKKKDKKIVISFELGKLMAEKAQDKKINSIVFDRAGNKYHGRVKATADGLRAGGLKF
ncbi:50S ribosomal protein L18 [Candidatus Falkowbacteria bacterium CG_4_9_14_3_um_filter_36_9]|uniref:Large ribosomal subunit protein uL18 n=2 Tax=Candidatus Falkowiibacteriota TaxID=1752728 RepID=A0A1J4TA80_9BACT|nr:MAG: 50S ribosomal protein L18 [Candidatus Falkowbacteria bacterium CG1_02_37_44]PIV51883.1 MAG: 50S ribosomal protein L18 [Candidatus Falkowbacteria bacterium CG02_land_8_20_14_3_00_36_14]PIX12084.1 MAG: 50S ribosomal protein L18 [Candidatus Falkowbacteria bacterium CG_4_8_14_3_um_filter_36_11]PJA10857.1 MAG: 50S ribosomal protein L18 [Candidatus Falkowbacteria bacterium CG_4_10_14_0_2_um_filter_36_22]PJB20208.1 MAG: 50S ribosomal protein L18 [Candidatus Falkowbacteria bacterium CG_4_9_14_3